MRGSRLKLWNTKPIFRLRSDGAPVAVEAGDVLAVEEVLPPVGPVEAGPRMFMKRGLAAARGARPRPRTSRCAIVDVDAAQRVDGHVAQHVALAQSLIGSAVGGTRASGMRRPIAARALELAG